MKALLRGLGVAFVLGATGIVSAGTLDEPGVIAYWDTTIYGVEAAPVELPYWTHNPNTIVGNLTPYGGLTKVGGNQAFSYRNWDTVINLDKYVGFTVTPKNGETLNLTSLQFGYAAVAAYNPANAIYQWRYRINEGGGYGDWVVSDSFPTGTGLKNWVFKSPIVTRGTVEFGFFSTAPSPTAAATPSYGGKTNAAVPGLSLFGTAGDASRKSKGVISRYTNAVTYSTIYMPREASALAYNWDTDTLFSIDDENTGIKEVSKTGQQLGDMGIGSFNFPSTGIKGDPEGLAYVGGGKFMIGAERQNVSTIVDYVKNGTNSPLWVNVTPDIVWGDVVGNTGLEGVSYDSRDGTYWGIREISPIRVIHATGVGTGTVVLSDIDLADIQWRVGISALSDIFVMANSDAYSESDNILLLARNDRKIIEITPAGQVADVVDISHIGRTTIEGITMDNHGVLYLCSEYSTSAGADLRFANPGLHVLTPAKNAVVPAARSSRGAVAQGTATDDEIYGTSASETFMGGGGSDTFVFKGLRDGVDTITDFTPGVDFINVSELLKAVGYMGSGSTFNPLLHGVIRVVESPDGAVFQVRSGASYRSFAILQGLTVQQASAEGNFHFITSRAASNP